MSAPSTERLQTLLDPIVSGHGLDLEEVRLTPAGRRRMLRVVVDKDGGVTLDDIADVSHSVSSALDESELLGGTAYTLEVTSPGVDRPLTLERHWRRATGRLVTVRLVDGRETTGRVLAADGELSLSSDNGTLHLPFAEVREGRVQIEFNHPAGTASDDLSDENSADDAADHTADDDEGDPWTST